jgi:hypothetical protein
MDLVLPECDNSMIITAFLKSPGQPQIHSAMCAFVYVFPLLFSIVAAIFDATKIAASGPQRNRNVNKRTHCIVVDQDSLSWYKLKTRGVRSFQEKDVR